MKRIFVFLMAAAVCLNVAAVSKAPKSKSYVVNTQKLGKEVMGYAGTTPLEIYVVDGRIDKIVALPNNETPAYFEKVQQSPIFTALVGKTVQEASEVQLDAVSGATWSSKAVIKNIQLGLKEAARKHRR
ncbi:MAG: FMN-binding protein [Bacteroidales bacterium]|nr:FMN-binding protein [Bacteroidales bacterium]